MASHHHVPNADLLELQEEQDNHHSMKELPENGVIAKIEIEEQKVSYLQIPRNNQGQSDNQPKKYIDGGINNSDSGGDEEEEISDLPQPAIQQSRIVEIDKSNIGNSFSRLQQSSREAQRRMDQENQKEYRVFPQDRMSKFQTALITTCFAQADIMLNYVGSYLCDRKFYMREWKEQCKASSFLVQWMQMVIPKMILKYKFETGQLEKEPDDFNIPQDSFNRCLMCLFAILDMNQPIYDYRTSSNGDDLLQNQKKLLGDNYTPYLKHEFLSLPKFNCSVFYVVSLQAFCQTGGFDLFELFLKGPGNKQTKYERKNYMPSFGMLSQVLNFLAQVKDMLEFQFFQKQVRVFRELALEFVQKMIDAESLRTMTKKDFTSFIHLIETLLTSAKLEVQENELYKYSELIELELALQCLSMPVLEKKFIGHAILAQKISQVKSSKNNTQDNPQAFNHISTLQQMRQKWLTKDFLIEWMDKNQIFNMLFGESVHSEVIKKSFFLLEFLYNNQKVGENEINLMWDCAMQKHEVYRVAILKALIFLGGKVDYPELKLLFGKIKSTSLAHTDKFLMFLLKTLAKNISFKIEGNHAANKLSSRLDQILKQDIKKRDYRVKDDLDVPSIKKKVIIDNEYFSPNRNQATRGRSSSFSKEPGLKINMLCSNSEDKAKVSPGIRTSSPALDLSESQEQYDINAVPVNKEDKNTADEDGSKKLSEDQPGGQLFDAFSEQREEEKEESKQQAGSVHISSSQNPISLKPLLQQCKFTNSKGPENMVHLQSLAKEIVHLMWQYSMEDSVTHAADQGGVLSKQVHQVAIEGICYTLNYLFPLFSFYYMKLAIQNIKRNYSVIASQMILKKIIECTSFPISEQQGIRLPQSQSEVIIALDLDLKITNECLNAYVDFKRQSVQLIFDQFAGNMDNDLIGGIGGDQDANLETQSSLDNNTNQNTGEERSRFSKSIISSTQKSDTAGSLTNPSRSQRRELHKIISASEHERGQSQPKPSEIVMKNKPSVQIGQVVDLNNQNLFFDKEPNSSSFKMTKGTNDALFIADQALIHDDLQDADSLDELPAQSPQTNLVSNMHRMKSNKEEHISKLEYHAEAKGHDKTIQKHLKEEPEQIKDSATDENDSPEKNISPHSSNERDAGNRQFLNQLITNHAFNLNFMQEMAQRLDFLKFLTKQAYCKTLKDHHINILWECLVVNGFSELERDQFFIFCTEVLTAVQVYQYRHKQQKTQNEDDLAGEILFDEDTLETIFFEILLRLDYKGADSNSFTEQMYLCFERFFLHINEQYGQVVINTQSLNLMATQSSTSWHASPLKFEVYDDQLIGNEALWEIVLSVQNPKIQERASKLLMKLQKKESGNESETKELFFHACMNQIQGGLKDINHQNQDLGYAQESTVISSLLHKDGQIQQLHPDLVNSASIDESKQRISKSIKLMSQYIEEYEGIGAGGAKSKGLPKNIEQLVHIIVTNHISNSKGPSKISLQLAPSLKVGELKEQIGQNLEEKNPGNQLSLMFRGKYLNDDLKTLKDYGMKSEQTDGRHSPVKIQLNLKDIFELEMEQYIKPSEEIYTDEQLNEQVETLRAFLGDLTCSEEVTKLALKKSKLNLEETMLIVTDPERIADLEEEVSKEQEEQIRNQLLVEQHQNLLSKQEEDKDEEPELKLNEMISNRADCFDLLFDLLNLGVPDITEASWALLTQVPVNQQLLSKIRLLGENMSQIEWSKIIDPNSTHKMLYSLKLVSQLITINNEKLSELEIQERFEWRQRFLELGGFEHLYFIMITYDFDSLNQNQVVFKQVKNHSKKPKVKVSKTRADMFQDTQAQCLSYLIGIIKIFLQAAILADDRQNLLYLIASTQTSPFRKNAILASNGANSNNSEVSDSHSDKDGTSSQNTPKFANSFMSQNLDTSAQKQIEETQPIFNQTQVPESKVQNLTSVDDFPKLIEQMNSSGIAKNILNNIVDFTQLVVKLLTVIQCSTSFSIKETAEGQSNQVSSLVQSCLDLLLPCVLWEPKQMIEQVCKFKGLDILIVQGLIKNKSEKIRKSIEQTFKILITEVDKLPTENLDFSSNFKLHLLKIMIENIPKSTHKGKTKNIESEFFEEYFNLLSVLIKSCQTQQNYNYEEVLSRGIETINQIQIIFAKKISESKQSSAERLLSGYLLLCQSILEIIPQLKSSAAQKFGLVEILTNFVINTKKQLVKPLSRATRKRALSLLLTICEHNEQNYTEALQMLFEFHSQIEKSWKYVDSNEFDSDIGLKQASGYVGLKNFGCTCYMNSLLQQLYMIPSLRTKILNLIFPSALDQEELDENLLYQLQTIFANLQESEKSYFIPKGFVNTFKFYGEPVNVRVQQDTHEFYNVLCDQVEQLLPKPQEQKQDEHNFLKHTIGGSICNETMSLETEYPYVGEREEPFYAITLDIKNKKTIQEALDTYIKPDILEGDNKYYCEQYDKKVSAQRRSYLKDLSDTVVINLKRFEFDYNTMTRLKVNDYCEFPERIDFRKWTKEGIQENEQNQQNLDQMDNEIIDEQKSELMAAETEGAQMDQGLVLIDEEDSEFKAKNETKTSPESKQSRHRRFRSSTKEQRSNLNLSAEFSDTMVHAEEEESRKVSINAKQDVNSDSKSYDKPLYTKPRGKVQAEKKPTNNFEYQLVGVLVHSGSADGGHYYSYIKERNKNSPQFGKWFEFNDTKVSDFSLINLKKECFGGQQQKENEFDDQPTNQQRMMYERCCNAYLIFYERIDSQTVSQNALNQQSEIIKTIHAQNQAFKHLKIFSENDFIQFMLEFVNLCTFQDVLYFKQEASDTSKIKKFRQLTQDYINDWNSQVKKAQRQADTQTLRGEAITPTRISIQRDYYTEQMDAVFSKADQDVFSQSKNDDIGLKTIKLAIILAVDIILKLKDSQTFIKLLQQLTPMFQSHALASVWFIKWVTDQTHVLQQVLLSQNVPEVREVFANLLCTTFAVVVRNEEPYLSQQDEFADFECEQAQLERFEVKNIHIPKAASIRLVKLFIEELINCAKVNWKNFQEFFVLIRDFAQTHFQVAAYLIHRGMIQILLQFVLNNKAPFYVQGYFIMGDLTSNPDFTSAWEVLSYLIKCCLTTGITQVSHYSPFSVFQEDTKQILLPNQQISGLMTNECFGQDILANAWTSSEAKNTAIEQIVVHLSWGDEKTSKFFIQEAIKHIKYHKVQVDQINFSLQIIKAIILIEDNTALRKARIDAFLNLQVPSFVTQSQAAGPSSGSAFFQSQTFTSLLDFLQKLTNAYPIYLLKVLWFIGSLAIQITDLKETLLQMRSSFEEWVWHFISRVPQQENGILPQRAKKIGIQFGVLHAETVKVYRELLEIDEQIPTSTEPFLETAIPLAHAPMNDQSGQASVVAVPIPKPNRMGEENIVDLLMRKTQNESFSNIPGLTQQTHNDSFGEIMETTKKNEEHLDEDDAELKNALGHLSGDIDLIDNPINHIDDNLLDDNEMTDAQKQGAAYDFMNFNDELMNGVGDVDFDQFCNFDENDPEFLKQQQEEYEKYQKQYKS